MVRVYTAVAIDKRLMELLEIYALMKHRNVDDVLSQLSEQIIMENLEELIEYINKNKVFLTKEAKELLIELANKKGIKVELKKE